MKMKRKRQNTRRRKPLRQARRKDESNYSDETTFSVGFNWRDEFPFAYEEMAWQKMLAETDPEKRQTLYRIYSGMICS
jgi:hypothetical protein